MITLSRIENCEVKSARLKKENKYLIMSSTVVISTADIILISINIATLLIVILSFFKAHTGDCRGALVTKTKTPDGCVTREAKLSMHEAHHDNIHELKSLRQNH